MVEDESHLDFPRRSVEARYGIFPGNDRGVVDEVVAHLKRNVQILRDEEMLDVKIVLVVVAQVYVLDKLVVGTDKTLVNLHHSAPGVVDVARFFYVYAH